MLVTIDIGNAEIKMFLLLYFSSDISFVIDKGRLNWVIVIAKEKVGKIKVYILIPYIHIYLVVSIFIIKTKSFVKNFPIIKYIIDFINFSFILISMFY